MYNYAVALEAYPINYYGNRKYKKHHYIVLLTCYSCLHVIEVEVQQTHANDGIHHQRQIYYSLTQNTAGDSKYSRRLFTVSERLCAAVSKHTALYTSSSQPLMYNMSIQRETVIHLAYTLTINQSAFIDAM